MAGNRNDIIPSVVPNWEKIPPLGGNIIWRQFCDYNWCVCVYVCVCGGGGVVILLHSVGLPLNILPQQDSYPQHSIFWL